MLTRRALFAASAVLPAAASSRVCALAWNDLPAAARRIAPELPLSAATWSSWQSAQRAATEVRIAEGTAEHVTYYALQSTAFTGAPPLEPVRLAHQQVPYSDVAARMVAFAAEPPECERHRLLRSIWNAEEWPLARCYAHTMAFLRAKEVEAHPLAELYERRGLSGDTQVMSAELLTGLGEPRRILLAGPGLDLTRREKFDDSLPLVSHQLDSLRRAYPAAAIECADVRPEVIRRTGAQRVDLTLEYPAGGYDLIVATNILLYFPLRELFTAMAGLRMALAPGGRLLHNEQRFAAKVFGEALGLPLERFEPHQFAPRRGLEQWDRRIMHRKGVSQ